MAKTKMPYMPLYVDDWTVDTHHLSLAAEGAYFRLVRLMWKTRGSVPNDDAWLQARLGVSADEMATLVRPVIAEFCTIKRGRITNKKLMAVWRKFATVSQARSAAGKKGAKAKWSKNNENADSNTTSLASGSEMLSQNPYPIDKKELPNGSSKKKGTRLSPLWVLDAEWCDWAIQKYGLSRAAVAAEADRFCDYWIAQPGQKGVKLDWFATWRNWVRRSVERSAPQAPRTYGQQFADRVGGGQSEMFKMITGGKDDV